MPVRVRLSIRVKMMTRFGLSNCHDEPPMLHALQTDQAAGELFDLSGLTVHDEDFKARIMIEVRMTGRDHKFVIGMLKFGQLLGNAVAVMIIDERDGADYCGIGTRRALCDQAIADQIAKGLGPIGIAEPGDEIVETFEKVGVQCYTDPTEDTHLWS